MTKKFWIDLGERVLVTAVGAFLATLIASGWFSVPGLVDTSILGKAGLAAAAAVLALLKGLAASFIGSSDSASLVK
ncbi:holin [Frankia sp. AgW1.1]|uniref:holin n=1 Tax=Frankia sp. AgW1.1 TaxID=1836971 RepID=UPI001932FF20|nr:holin [Frankia sp. AgW1.1]MBL7487064.1 hypothetical protein [Frankia sp. AgW1.1]